MTIAEELEIAMLEAKIERLRDSISNVEYEKYLIEKENEKLKKAIEILKMQTSIENIKCENGNIYIVNIGDISVLITQQEYELLKEVLEKEPPKCRVRKIPNKVYKILLEYDLIANDIMYILEEQDNE